MKNALLCTFLMLALFACSNNEKPLKTPGTGQALEDPTLFPDGILVAGELEKDETHKYEVDVQGGYFVFGQVNQKTVDVEVHIFNPEEEEIAIFDGPATGMENFSFDADLEGTYRVEVKAFEEGEGSYTIQLIKNEPKANTPQKRVDQLLSDYDNDFTPGAVVGVIEGGKVTYAKGFGMANLAYDIPYTTDMPSNIGSVSKQFTAMGILLLEKEGKLSLDDDIRKHLPELPEFEQTIRVKNLLNHTNGLREIYNMLPMRGWNGEDAILREEAIKIVQRQPELQALPGEEFNYNNTAFILLTHIVERLTDQSFPEWMEENVFDPLGMQSTYIRRDPGHIIPNATQGYISDENGFREAGDLYAAYGAGGIYTTIDDFAKWLKNFQSGELGGAEIIEKLTTPGILNNGDTMSYALGLGISEYRGLKRYSHTGGDIAHRTNLIYFPEIDKGVVTNSNNGSYSLGVANEIIDAFFEKHLEPEEAETAKEEIEKESLTLTAEQLQAFEGKFKSDAIGLMVELKLEEEQLRMEIAGDSPMPLTAVSENTFEGEGGNISITFHSEENEVKGATLTADGADYEFNKLAGFDPSEEELQAYVGKYYSRELETVYTISIKEGQLVAQIYGLEDIELSPAEEDSFTGSEFFVSEMTFKRNPQGRVSGFEVGNGRTKGVAFERMSTL